MRYGMNGRQPLCEPRPRNIAATAAARDTHRFLFTIVASALWALAAFVIPIAGAAAASSPTALQVGNLEVQPTGNVAAVIDVPTWRGSETPRFELVVADKSVQSSEVKRLEQAPITLVLCIDKSGSMRKEAMDGIKEGVQAFLRNSSEKVEVAMIGFGSTTKTLANFGVDNRERAAAVQALQLEGRESKTALYEALHGGIAQLKARKSRGTKRIIVITDGQDEGSAVKLEQVIQAANASGVVVDAISTGLFAPRGVQALERLAGDTQGTVVKVPNGASVGPALEDLVAGARGTGASFQVLFKYPPASGQKPTENAVIALVPATGDRVTQSVAGSFMPVAASAPPVADQGKGSGERSSNAFHFTVPFSLFPVTITLPVLLALAAILAAAIVVFVYARRGRREPIPAAPPPPVVEPTVAPRPRTAAAPVAAAPRSTRIVRQTFPPPQPGSPTALLKGRSGPIGNLTVAIDKTPFRIGAGEGCDLRLATDEYVSNDHATIRYDSGSLYVADRGSRNGTFLNGTRLAAEPMSLSIGDELRFGHSQFVVDGASAAPARERMGEGSVR
jgi:Mg-chelatase subunit ChlD